MGRDGVFFRSLGWVHASYRTPAFSIVVQAAMSIGLVLASSILVQHFHSFKSTTTFDVLTNYVIFASLGDPPQANIGLGLIALGIPVYFGWQRWQATGGRRDELPGEL
jgi:amino acid transporter